MDTVKKIIMTDRVRQGMDHDFFEELSDVEFLTAYSNADALRIHGREHAALIITELYGAGMNACQFCDILRAEPATRGVSVIVCCRDNEIELAEAARCKANAVLTLPLGRTTLRSKVHELLSISSRGRFHSSFSARRGGAAPRASIHCRTENISVTGMLIEADAELHRGETVQCSLALPPASTFVTRAEVVRIDRDQLHPDRRRYGVRFDDLVPAARRAIEAIVSQHPRP